MATNCSWCGEKIGFWDVTYIHEKVDDTDYFICSECSNKISKAKSGEITFEEIKTDKTEQELFDNLAGEMNFTEETLKAQKDKKEKQKIKIEARQIDPLYDDIHQIAQDLRFIKNYLVFCIAAGIVLCLIAIFSGIR